MRPIDLFDNYLNGTLSEGETINFDARLASDSAFANAFEEHKALVNALNSHAERDALKKKLKGIHNEAFGSSKIISINSEETFARRHGKTIAVAASTALFAVLSTVA